MPRPSFLRLINPSKPYINLDLHIRSAAHINQSTLSETTDWCAAEIKGCGAYWEGMYLESWWWWEEREYIKSSAKKKHQKHTQLTQFRHKTSIPLNPS